MGMFRQDVRFGMRVLHRSPAFTVVVLLTIAVCIGAGTAIFSLLDAVLLKPLPFSEPDRLVMIWNVYGDDRVHSSPPDYLDRKEASRLLESIAAFRLQSFNLTGEGEPQRLPGVSASAGIFPTLGVAPMLGRVFLPEEDQPGRDGVIVLSHAGWIRRFGADSSVIGKRVRLNDRAVEIIGVMPPDFGFLFPEAEVWAPLALPPEAAGDDNRGNEYLSVMARLRRGVALEQAQAEMEAIAAAVLEKVPARRPFLLTAKWSARVSPLREEYSDDLRPVVRALAAAVLLVLLIGCVNIANLLLARAASRQKEFSVRAALGAERRQIVRQLLAEAACLSLAGGALGVLLAWWSIRVMRELYTLSPLLAAIRLDLGAVSFAAGLTVATTVLFGLVPALRAGAMEGLGGAGRVSASAAGLPLRRLLVIGEVAVALLLLLAAGLLIRSAQRLAEIHPGYATSQRLTFRLSLPALRYPDNAQRTAFQARLLEKLSNLPGVRSAGAIQSLPLAGTADTATIHLEARPVAPGQPEHSGEYRFISPGYLRSMGIPLLQGRDLTSQDAVGAPLVALVDEEAAQRFWPGENPIGKRLGFNRETWREVVGVVGSVRNRGLDTPGREQVYFPLLQQSPPTIFYVLHAAVPQSGLAAELRQAVGSVDPGLPLYDLRTMEDRVSEWMAPRRLTTGIVGLFAAVSLLLSSLGIYGVISSWVRQRMPEIGIRVALGARPGQVFRLVLGQGMALTLLGIALGAAGGTWTSRLLENLLFGVQPHDLVTLAGVVSLLLLVAVLACYLPARRAMRLDPMSTLRQE